MAFKTRSPKSKRIKKHDYEKIKKITTRETCTKWK